MNFSPVAAEEETTRETAVETFEFGGVRVSVIEDKHTCGTCSKVFEGKLGRPNVIVHIRNCHLSKNFILLNDRKRIKH